MLGAEPLSAYLYQVCKESIITNYITVAHDAKDAAEIFSKRIKKPVDSRYILELNYGEIWKIIGG